MNSVKKHIPGTPSRNIRRKSLLPTYTNDDEAERNQLRREAELESKLANISISQANTSNIFSAHEENLEINLNDHFNTCLQMFTKNKINTKNVWNLNILDYMKSLVSSNSELRNILQIASTSIDIETKIYSLRVDDIYDEILKLANALTKVNIGKKKINDGDSEGSEEENEEACSRPKRKKKRVLDDQDVKVTIAVNEEGLNAPIKKHTALFTQCADSTDTGTLLNMSLVKRPGSYELLTTHHVKEYMWYSRENSRDKMMEGTSQNEPQLNRSLLEALPNASICPPFKGFLTDTWDVDSEEQIKAENEVVLDENGIPVPSLDPDLDDPDHYDAVFEDTITVNQNAKTLEAVFITDMKPVNNGTVLEYSYRPLPSVSEHFNVPGIWAGPSHWKLKCLRKSDEIKVDGEVEVKKPRARRKIVPKKKPVEFEDLTEEDIKGILTCGRKKKTFHLVMTNRFEVCTFPEYMAIKKEQGIFLMNRPRYKLYLKPQPIQKHDDLELSNYEYDNENDNEYCSVGLTNSGWDQDDQNTNDQNLNDDGVNPVDMDENCPQNMSTNVDDSFTVTADIVSPTFVPYATTAKKMDMKKLKNAMWNELTGTDANTEGNEEPMNEAVKTTTLKAIYKELPFKISTSMSENLSAPLAFVALLHLANEHNLELEKNDLSDVVIKKKTTD